MRELAGVVAPLRHAQQDFARVGLHAAARQFQRRLPHAGRNALERQAVATQILLRHLDRDLVLPVGEQVDLRDVLVLEQAIAHDFRQLSQRPLVHIAVEYDIDDAATVHLEHDLRLFRVLGKRGDAIDFLLDVLVRLLVIGVGEKFGADHADAFRRRRRHFLNAVEPAHALFDREDNALLDLLRARAGIRHGDRHHVRRKLGKDLLLDSQRDDQAADHQHDHQQVRRDAVADHPRDQAAFGVLVVG